MSDLCKGCKRSLTLKEASMQTDEPLNTKRLPINSPPPLRTQKTCSPSKMLKIEQNLGDVDNLSEGLDSESDDFYIDTPYVRKSLGKDETIHLGYGFCKEELTESTKVRSFFPNKARQTPDPKKQFEELWLKKSRTPGFHNIKPSKNETFTESYEKIVKGCKVKNSVEFRECFKKLVFIEKKSLQETLKKKLGTRKLFNVQ